MRNNFGDAIATAAKTKREMNVKRKTQLRHPKQEILEELPLEVMQTIKYSLKQRHYLSMFLTSCSYLRINVKHSYQGHLKINRTMKWKSTVNWGN